MAKLVDVYRNERALVRRQLPLIIDENLTMVMDFNSMGLVCDNTNIRGKELEEFSAKVFSLSHLELKKALEVSLVDIQSVLDQAVPCVGCRRSVERLFFQLMTSGHPTLDPIVFNSDGTLTIREDKIQSPNMLCTLFHGHSTRLQNLVDSQPRSKKSQRCLLHSLDSQRPRPVTPAWRDVWECMRQQCKEEVVLIEATTLHATLENYLRKHRFCGECRTKVLRAYTLLVEEKDPCKEKGYVAALYSGIKRCLPDKHLHLQTKTEYIANLIVRAEPEIMGSRRERHAKTLEIAQEEVLTCLGICVYERLHRIYMRLREEECTCQVLAAVAVDCLCRSFETAVEVKRGVSQLELLFEELAREEQLKLQRKEQKKLKRKRKKERRAEIDEKENCDECHLEIDDSCGKSLDNSCVCTAIKPVSPKKHEVKVNKDVNINSCSGCTKIVKHNKNVIVKEKVTLNGNCIAPDKIFKKPLHNQKCAVRNSSDIGCSVEEKCNNNICTKVDISLSSCQSCQCEKEDVSGMVMNRKTVKKRSTRLNEGWSSSEHSQDCGYSSENNNGCCDTASGSSSLPSSPEGSEVACSEGFCNHEGDCHIDSNHSTFHDCDHSTSNIFSSSGNSKLTLQQMLDSCSSDEDGEESYIPAEEVLEFKSKICHLDEKRQELRQKLKSRFAQLCVRVPLTHPRVLVPTKISSD